MRSVRSWSCWKSYSSCSTKSTRLSASLICRYASSNSPGGLDTSDTGDRADPDAFLCRLVWGLGVLPAERIGGIIGRELSSAIVVPVRDAAS